jgi:hypothetical protein
MKDRGQLYIEFTAKGNRFDLEKFFADRQRVSSITKELKNRMDQELKRRGINVKNSRMEPDFQKFGLKYQAEYDPPKRYGIAVGAAIMATVKAVVKAIIQAIKIVIKLIVEAIKAIVKFLQKLMVYIKNLIQFFDQAIQRFRTVELTQEGNLNPNNPDDGLNNMEKELDKDLGGGTSSNILGGGTSSNILSSPNSWMLLGGAGALALVLLLVLKK